MTGLRKSVLFTNNTPMYSDIYVSLSISAIQNLLHSFKFLSMQQICVKCYVRMYVRTKSLLKIKHIKSVDKVTQLLHKIYVRMCICKDLRMYVP